MIRKLSIVLLLSSLAYYSNAQKIEPVWGKQYISGKNKPFASSIASDSIGNIYNWLKFKDTMRVGDFVLKSPTVITILLKFNTKGELLWKKIIAEKSSGLGGSITSLNDTLLLVYGSYKGIFEIKPGIILDSFDNASEQKGFLMCIDTSGEVLWARATPNQRHINYLHANSSGFFVKGTTLWSTNDSIDIFGIKIPRYRYFIIHFDFAGNTINAHYNSQDADFYFHGDIQNNLISGAYLEYADSFALDTIILYKSNPQRNELFIFKRNGFGQIVWVREFNTLETNGNFSDKLITSDKNQNIYVSFAYRDSFIYDTITYYGLSSTKIAIAKFSPNGKLLWINTSESSLDGFYEFPRKLIWENNQLTLYAEMHSASVFDSFTFPTAEPQQTQIIRFDTATGKVTDAFGLWLVGYEQAKGPGLSYYQFASLMANPLLTIKGYHFTRINDDEVLVKLDTLTWWKTLPENSFNQLQVYPNPVNNKLYVSLPAHKSAFQLQILDLNGRLMETIEVAPNEQEIFIDTGRLPKGFYILHAQSPGGKHSFAKFTRM